MILDSRLMFADGVSIVGAVGTNLVGNVVDTGAVHRDLGNGEDIFFFVEVTADIQASAGAGTVVFQLITSASSNMSSPTVVASSGTIVTNVAAAGLGKAGSQAYFSALPIEGQTYLEYIGIQVVVGGQPVTAGSIKSGLTLHKHGWQAYPRNYL